MFAMAVRHDALASNPIREVRRPPRQRRAVQALSVEQARNLLGLTASHRDGVARDERGLVLGGARRTPDLHDVVLMLLGTGMRIGEALALRWTDLDLDAEIPAYGWTPPWSSPAATPPADRYSSLICTVNR
jgi:integrase